MRKTAGIFAALIIALFLAGCGQSRPAPAEGALRVVATIFPQYDFVRHIAGDRVALTMLLSPGAESHGFEPTPRDIIAINNAHLLIYVGGHGDVWVNPILASLGREDLRTVALLDLVDAVEQEIVEGMEIHHAHDHAHGHDHHAHAHAHTHHTHEPHYDEHVWTCPRNAIVIVRALADILAELDPDNASFFRENAAAYIAELQELDRAFAGVVADAARRTVIFGDRFPFRYLTDTYGLTYFAAFTGCSAETQASPATIAFLIERIRQEDIPVVFHIEFSNRLIANVIAEATGARLLELHSLHNVSHADFTAGVTYLDLMRRNVETLREALN
ncbi:MAG: metal ABC transporter substrate-binding protein [Treponema sp.]|nr:metal ABC transporter substrate-binding protein [Treponema sp.]